MSEIQGLDLVQIRQNMTGGFSPGELEILCFDLSIPLADIPGPEHSNRIVQVISYCQRHGQLLNLVDYCGKARPHLTWRQEILPQASTIETVEARIEHRHQLEQQANGIQLVHTILPASAADGYWDILIYLIRHRSEDLSIVAYAEFFLGRYWGNKIFRANNSENFIGIAISAYGPALCTCRVVFTDGQEVMLNRYIDLEMTGIFSELKKEATNPARPRQVSLSKLRASIEQNFNRAELSDLCFNLGIERESLPGGTKPETIYNLIGLMSRTARLPELLEMCRQERPYAQWDNIYEGE